MATIGPVTYPTAETAEVQVTGITRPTTFTVSDGTETVLVAPYVGSHTISAEAGGLPVTATLIPGNDVPAAQITSTAVAPQITASVKLGAASFNWAAAAPKQASAVAPGPHATFNSVAVAPDTLAATAGHRIRAEAGGPAVYATVVLGLDGPAVQIVNEVAAPKITATVPGPYVEFATVSADFTGVRVDLPGAQIATAVAAPKISASVPGPFVTLTSTSVEPAAGIVLGLPPVSTAFGAAAPSISAVRGLPAASFTTSSIAPNAALVPGMPSRSFFRGPRTRVVLSGSRIGAAGIRPQIRRTTVKLGDR